MCAYGVVYALDVFILNCPVRNALVQSVCDLEISMPGQDTSTCAHVDYANVSKHSSVDISMSSRGKLFSKCYFFGLTVYIILTLNFSLCT